MKLNDPTNITPEELMQAREELIDIACVKLQETTTFLALAYDLTPDEASQLTLDTSGHISGWLCNRQKQRKASP